jgi:hypothetical protein
MASFDRRHDSGNYLRRVVALSCAQSRIFLSGPYAGLLALIPFFIISLLLYLVGRDLLLVSRARAQ